MWPRSVRATQVEQVRVLPGDDLIPEPIGTLTHAITIRRPPREVWPWLAQMGAGSRAGWYSYDILDNVFPAAPGATDGFHVLELEARRNLVLGWLPAPNASPIMTWAFVLEAVNDGTTRLVVRARGARAYPFYDLPPSIGMPLVRFGHFVMERKQLLGIASRVESRHSAGINTTTRPEAA